MTIPERRYQKRTKQRRNNLILNVMIGIVIILIVIVGGNIMFGNDSEEASVNGESEQKPVTEENIDEEDQDEEDQSTTNEAAVSGEDDEANRSDDTEVDDSATTQADTDQDLPAVSGEGIDVTSEYKEDDSNVIKAIKDGWEPVPTTQTGEHVTSYETDSLDWQERVKAVSYATGIHDDNLIIWWMGNNGSANRSIATVSTKNQAEIYDVELVWVENKGWKPVLVKQLQENYRNKQEDANEE